MTVKELKAKLDNLPDDMYVLMDERLSEFKYGLVNSARVIKIDFHEGPSGEVLSTEDLLVLSED
jgi:hypothetical protein